MASPPKKIAFVVNALTGDELSGGIRDASMIYSLLTDPGLGGCSVSPPPMHQCESRSVFEKSLNGLLEKWNVADQLVLYFSGHGEIQGDKYCLKLGTSKGDLLPFDNVLNDLNISYVTKAIIILDTCYSGDAIGVKSDNFLQQTINQKHLPKGIAILASSRRGELSHELSDGSSSIFTYLLCEGLSTGLKGKPTIDGLITISDIVEFINNQIDTENKFNSVTQRPAYSITDADRSIWISKNKSGSISAKSDNASTLVTSFDELRLLYEKTAPDRHPCYESSVDDLEWGLVQKFSSKILGHANDLSNNDILNQLHLFSPISYENRYFLHKSAVLCFARVPALFYPQAKSVLIVGNLENETFIREDVNGPLSNQVEVLVEKVREHLDTISYIGENGLRAEKTEIDDLLIRELISNAIAHRDYDQSGNVTIIIRPEALEIKSPGKFPDNFSWSVALEENLYGSRPVNIAISYYLSYLLVFEGVGRGLAILKKYMDRNGSDSVKISELPGPITCISILRKKKLNEQIIAGGQYSTFINQIGTFSPPPDLIQLRKDYLAYIERSYHALDFKGIPQLRNLTNELDLEEVYMPLLARPELPEGETWERRLAGRGFDRTALPEEALRGMESDMGASVPVQIEDALREKQRVTVLGDPGSGKSTMLKYFALRLAKENGAPLPILLPLNAYAKALSQKEINLQSYLAEYFAARAEGVASLAPLFKEAIEHGKAVILLDGLDEVQSNRAALVKKVEDFAHDVVEHGNRVLVTSRIVGYREAPLAPKDWSLYTLLDFTPEAIETFAGKWCRAFEKGTLGDTPEAEHAAEVEKRSLLEALKNNPGVARLASNPLLLTILALIKRQGVELPKSRIKLYDRYLETLIEAWNRTSALDKSAGRASMDYESTLEILGMIALHVREENPVAGLISTKQLLDWLAEYYMGEQWDMKAGLAKEKAREFLDSVRRYSNLLVERGEGLYGFLHLTFEEALAAYGLVRVGQLDRKKSLTYIQKHLTDPAWRETILLSVSASGLINRQPLVAGELALTILNTQCGEEHAGQNVLLAGACLEDVGEFGLGKTATSLIQSALIDAMNNRLLPPAVQRDAGFSLARTGWMPADLDMWIEISAGEFLYGDEKRKAKIEKPFAMQKYPVTNLQFKRFMDDRGYEKSEFWSADGWAWRTGTYDSKAQTEYMSWLSNRSVEKRYEPYYWHNEKWNNPLAPVVGITWFEAEAYANWLGKQFAHEVRLPTEHEWERAARGTQGLNYTWGDEFNKDKVNSEDFWGSYSTEVMSTTIVGQFHNGITVDGISDLSGNIWEWTMSWYEEEEKKNRTIRGGSWSSYYGYVRSAYRGLFVPDFFDSNIGFRLVSPRL